MRKCLLTGILILLYSIIVLPQQIKFNEPVKYYPAEGKSFYWPYYLFIPESAQSYVDSVVFFVIPNNTGVVNDTLEVHEKKVLQTIKNAQMICSSINAVLLVPVFPRPESEWKVYTHALDRDVMLTSNDSLKRTDLQLINMIADAKAKLTSSGINVKQKIMMMGFSASAMYVNRFCFLHPEIVAAAAVGSPGGWPIVPEKEFNNERLNYPVGINDFEKISGTPINLAALKNVKLYFYLGDKDENDSVVYDDSYDEPERKVILDNFGKTLQDRWKIAKILYEKAGLSNSVFITYKDVGHTMNKTIISDLLKFFTEANPE